MKEGDVSTTDTEAGRKRRAPDRLINQTLASPSRKSRIVIPLPPSYPLSHGEVSDLSNGDESVTITDNEEDKSDASTVVLPSTPRSTPTDRTPLKRTKKFCERLLPHMLPKAMVTLCQSPPATMESGHSEAASHSAVDPPIIGASSQIVESKIRFSNAYSILSCGAFLASLHAF